MKNSDGLESVLRDLNKRIQLAYSSGFLVHSDEFYATQLLDIHQRLEGAISVFLEDDDFQKFMCEVSLFEQKFMCLLDEYKVLRKLDSVKERFAEVLKKSRGKNV